MAAYRISFLYANKSTFITGDFVSKHFNLQFKKIIDNYVTVHNKKVVVIELSTNGIFQRY